MYPAKESPGIPMHPVPRWNTTKAWMTGSFERGKGHRRHNVWSDKGKLEFFQSFIWLKSRKKGESDADKRRTKKENCVEKAIMKRRTCTGKTGRKMDGGCDGFCSVPHYALADGASAVSAADGGRRFPHRARRADRGQTETQKRADGEKEEELIECPLLIQLVRLWLPKGSLDIQNDFTGLKLSDGDHVN